MQRNFILISTFFFTPTFTASQGCRCNKKKSTESLDCPAKEEGKILLGRGLLGVMKMKPPELSLENKCFFKKELNCLASEQVRRI